jgi:hypothetical protein
MENVKEKKSEEMKEKYKVESVKQNQKGGRLVKWVHNW